MPTFLPLVVVVPSSPLPSYPPPFTAGAGGECHPSYPNRFRKVSHTPSEFSKWDTSSAL